MGARANPRHDRRLRRHAPQSHAAGSRIQVSAGQLTLNSDAGAPTVVADPDGRIAEIYRGIARRLAVKIDELSLDHSALFANIVIQDT